MEMIYLRRVGDDQIIKHHYKKMVLEPIDQLIIRFNKISKLFGNHQQLLYIIALDKAFYKSCGKSPIKSEQGVLFGGLERSIIQVGDSWEFLPSDN